MYVFISNVFALNLLAIICTIWSVWFQKMQVLNDGKGVAEILGDCFLTDAFLDNKTN